MAVPTNQTVPVITGSVEVGYTLTASEGTWTGGPTSYAFQWYRVNDNAVAITGATSSSYVITAEDTGHALRVGVIATNNTGPSAQAFSVDTIDVPADWFIVEDGTIVEGAISYVTLDYANEYHARRVNSAWLLLTVGQKKAALVKATDYLKQKYRLKWQGDRVSAEQPTDWPRNWVEYVDYAYITQNGSTRIGGFIYYPANIVPEEVKQACCELALLSLSGALYGEQGQRVKREKVDVLEVEYQDYTSPARVFPVVDGYLAPLLKQTSGQVVRM